VAIREFGMICRRSSGSISTRRADTCPGLQGDEASSLLGPSEAEHALWVDAPVLTPAISLRLSYVFGIHVDLSCLLPAPGRAARWMRQPNSAALFGGGTALEYLLEHDVAMGGRA